MKRLSDRVSKVIITVFLVVSFLLLPKVGFNPEGGEGFDFYRNVMFPLSHANIFHLACNIICLWQIRDISRYLVGALAISALSSLLPFYNCNDIMGVSGVLFAIIGMKYGERSAFVLMMRNVIPFLLLTVFIPNVAALFHFYCLMIAYAVGWFNETIRLWKNLLPK